MRPIDRARDILKAHDNGTHFAPGEVIGALRELIDAYDAIQPNWPNLTLIRSLQGHVYHEPLLDILDGKSQEFWKS